MRGKPCLANRVWRHSPAKFSRHHLLDIVWIRIDNSVGKRSKTINIKKFGGTPPLLDRNHAVDLSHLSRGNVPFVLGHFVPSMSLSHLCGIIRSPQMWERAHVGFGGAGRKRKGLCTGSTARATRAWWKHALRSSKTL